MTIGIPSARPKSEWQQWAAVVRTQVRVTGALVRREMRAHFGQSRLGYLWAIIDPALHLVAYIVLFSTIMRRQVPFGGGIALFLMTGIIPYFMAQKLWVYVAGAITGNKGLLSLPPVKPFSVIAARVILQSATYLLVATIMFLSIYLSGVPEALPYDLMSVIGASILAIGLGLGVGMINLVLQAYIHNWMMIFSMMSFPLWLLSGIWFLPDQVPHTYRVFLEYNPLLHILMFFRTGFYREFKADSLDLAYTGGLIATLLVVGLVLTKAARRKILEP